MFYTYILLCNDKTLYTGYTVDLKKRLEAHNNGVGGKYTRARKPVKLIYSEVFKSKNDAQKREWEIKSWTRKKKIVTLELNLAD